MTMAPEPVDRFTYICDAGTRVIRVVARQTLTLDDVVGIIDRQVAEGRWSFGILYDLRRVDAALSKEEAARVAEHANAMGAANGPRGPVALVADTQMVGARAVYAIRTRRTQHVEVFWDLDEAQKWLTDLLGAP
jgi:hypothetical protein